MYVDYICFISLKKGYYDESFKKSSCTFYFTSTNLTSTYIKNYNNSFYKNQYQVKFYFKKTKENFKNKSESYFED